MACPAFYNLLVAIAETPDFEEKLLDDGMLKKMVYVSKFFDPKHQMDYASALSYKVVDGETIFEQFLAQYNPEKEQQDACDFLCFLLDQCHEELKQFYVAPAATSKALKQLKGDGDWNDVSGLKAKSYQENTEQIFEPSIIRDIFGGVLQTEFHVGGSKTVSTTEEPFFVLNLEIPKNGDYNLSTCLESYFNEKRIDDYEQHGKKVKATHK